MSGFDDIDRAAAEAAGEDPNKKTPGPKPKPGPKQKQNDQAKVGEHIPAGEGPGADQGPRPNTGPEIKTSDVLCTIYESIFNSFLRDWKVSSEETKTMAEMQGAAIDLWFPDGVSFMNNALIEKIIVTGGAVAVTAQVLGPRMKKPEKKKPAAEPGNDQKPKEDSKKKADNSAGDPEYSM